MKKALIIALTSAILFTTAAWSQSNITNGSPQTSLVGPSGNKWNQHAVAIYDSTGDTYSGNYLYYWSCGSGGQDGICVATMSPMGHVTTHGQPITFSTSGTICDMQDPGVVRYTNPNTNITSYYVYAAGVYGSGSCATYNGDGNQHAAIYGWVSADGMTSFSALNGGKPVIQLGIDGGNDATPSPCFSGAPSCYVGHGINGPSPVVMQSCNCIRMYYWYQVTDVPSGATAGTYGLIPGGQGVESQDSTDGATFTNERVIYPGPYWVQVKRTGLNGSDYPLVMTLNGSSSAFNTAISDGFSDTAWYCAYSSTPSSPNSSCSTNFSANTPANEIGYPPHLESDVTGLLLDSDLNPLSVSTMSSKQLYLDWDNGDGNYPTPPGGNYTSFLYRGNTPPLNLFNNLASDPAPWLTEFIPSTYPTDSGTTATFYIQGEDYAGGSAVTYLQPFFSVSSDMSNLSNSCHLMFSSSNNTLYLDSSAGDFSWVGSQPSGGSWSGTNSNGVCEVNSTPTWSTSASGDYLTLTVNVTFLQNLTWYEFGAVSNLIGNSPWLSNGLTWSY